MWECSHALIPLPCRNTHKLFSWVTRHHRCRESVQSLLWKYPLILSFSHETPLPQTTLFMFPPVQNRPASCQAKHPLFLPPLFISLRYQLLLSPLHPSIQRFLSVLQHTPPTPLPSVWTRLAPGNKQRRVCVRGGRDGVSLSEGTMLLLVALNRKLLLPFSVCLCLINCLQLTFTKPQNALTTHRLGVFAISLQPWTGCCFSFSEAGNKYPSGPCFTPFLPVLQVLLLRNDYIAELQPAFMEQTTSWSHYTISYNLLAACGVNDI